MSARFLIIPAIILSALSHSGVLCISPRKPAFQTIRRRISISCSTISEFAFGQGERTLFAFPLRQSEDRVER
jgi:hypothetical protein